MNERQSKLQRLLNNAPPGAAEGLDALRTILGGTSPQEDPIEAEFRQVEGASPGSGLQIQDDPNQEDGLEIPSPSNEIGQSLQTLPTAQQTQLNAFSKELASKFEDGASSLVDQGVMAMLQRLPQAGQDKWWKLILSGREGWKALAAEGKETAARAKLRSSIADTAITIANLGEEEMEREVFQTFISTLKRSMGEEGIQTFCEEHDMEIPPEGSQAEKILLLRIHSANLGLARYREALRDQMVKYTHEKASIEGATAMSRMKAEMLPVLIEAKKIEYPLQQKRWFQKVGHGSALFVGTFTSIASGVVIGGLAGAWYGSEEALDSAKKRAGKSINSAGKWVGDKADDIGKGFKKGISNSFDKLKNINNK